MEKRYFRRAKGDTCFPHDANRFQVDGMRFYYNDAKKKGTLCLRDSFLASEIGGKIEPRPPGNFEQRSVPSLSEMPKRGTADEN